MTSLNPGPIGLASNSNAPVPHLRIVRDRETKSTPATAPSSVEGPAWARQYQRRIILSDIAIVLGVVFAAFLSGSAVATGATALVNVPIALALAPTVIAITWIIMLSVYHTRDARIVGIGLIEYRRVVNASVLAFGLLAIAFLATDAPVDRGLFAVALPAGLLGLMLSRLVWRKWLVRRRVLGDYVSRTIVVGERQDVEYVIRQIKKNPASAYAVAGTCVSGSSSASVFVAGEQYAVVSDLEGVADAAARLSIDTVIVAGQPAGGGNFIRDLGWDLEGTAAELVVASGLTNIAGPRIHFRPVEGLPLMHVELPQFEGGKHTMKRALDIVLSSMALIFIAPLLAVIAILVRSDSAGPVFFRQERVGRGGKTFIMHKFRSMVTTAEFELASLRALNDGSGALFKMKEDPRVTRIGRMLRKYSLDELPQLWNILIGDMSLVGPRPPLRSEVETYDDRVHRRLYIKPGLTGMWQVNGRSDLDWDESVRLDLYYVENWSLAGDLVIMWRTFKVIRGAVGAY